MITAYTKKNAGEYDALFTDLEQLLNQYGISDESTKPAEGWKISTLNQYFTYLGTVLERLDTISSKTNPSDEEKSLIEQAKTDKKKYYNRLMRLPISIDENFFQINLNERTIKIPDTFAKNGVGVAGDAEAEVLYFIVDRYFENVDLFTQHIIIEYTSVDGKVKQSSPAINKDIYSQADKIIFGWALTKDVVTNFGNITFSVRFYTRSDTAPTDESSGSYMTYSLSTQPASIMVKKSLYSDMTGGVEATVYENAKKAEMNFIETSLINRLKAQHVEDTEVPEGYYQVPKILYINNQQVTDIPDDGLQLTAIASARNITYRLEKKGVTGYWTSVKSANDKVITNITDGYNTVEEYNKQIESQEYQISSDGTFNHKNQSDTNNPDRIIFYSEENGRYMSFNPSGATVAENGAENKNFNNQYIRFGTFLIDKMEDVAGEYRIVARNSGLVDSDDTYPHINLKLPENPVLKNNKNGINYINTFDPNGITISNVEGDNLDTSKKDREHTTTLYKWTTSDGGKIEGDSSTLSTCKAMAEGTYTAEIKYRRNETNSAPLTVTYIVKYQAKFDTTPSDKAAFSLGGLDGGRVFSPPTAEDTAASEGTLKKNLPSITIDFTKSNNETNHFEKVQIQWCRGAAANINEKDILATQTIDSNTAVKQSIFPEAHATVDENTTFMLRIKAFNNNDTSETDWLPIAYWKIYNN